MEISRVPGFLAVPTFRNASAPPAMMPTTVGKRLDVVHDRRPLIQPADREPRRPVARVALLALDRRQQRRCLATNVRPGATVDHQVAREIGAEDLFAEIAGSVGFFQRPGEPAVRQIELAANVDERVSHPQRIRSDKHRLKQQVRRILEYPAILERAWLALVGVGAQVMVLAIVEVHDSPFPAHGKGRAAAPLDAGGADLGGYLLRRHLPQHAFHRGVAAAPAVVGQRVRVCRDRKGHQQLGISHARAAPRGGRRASRG